MKEYKLMNTRVSMEEKGIRDYSPTASRGCIIDIGIRHIECVHRDYLSKDWDLFISPTVCNGNEKDGVKIDATFVNKHNNDYVVYIVGVDNLTHKKFIGQKRRFNENSWGELIEPVTFFIF